MEKTGTFASQQEDKEYYVEKDGIRFSGVHLLVDMWGGQATDDAEKVEATLREAVEACGATLLSLKMHVFTPNSGLTAVATLSESHISIHSWPEAGYTAVDIFTCGSSNPYKVITLLRERFAPDDFQITEQKRGVRIAA